jgi:amino acid permease
MDHQAQVYTNEKEGSDIEKGHNSSVEGTTKYENAEKEQYHGAEFVSTADEKFQFDARDLDQVQRKLQQRHVQMYVFHFPLDADVELT